MIIVLVFDTLTLSSYLKNKIVSFIEVAKKTYKNSSFFVKLYPYLLIESL